MKAKALIALGVLTSLWGWSATAVVPVPAEVFVSPQGNDANGDGTLVRPFATLERAMLDVGPGSRVLLRGGVYRQARQFIRARGTTAAPIVVGPYPGESVVFDASGLEVGPDDAVIELANATHVVLERIEVRSSTGRGIALKRVEHVEVSRCTVHDVAQRAIGGHGRDIRILDNEVYRAALMNEGGGRSSGWPAAISTWTPPGEPLTRNVTIRGNYVHEVWGEGITALLLEDGAIEANRIRDTFGSAIYIDTSRRIRVNANHVSMKQSDYRRGGRFATGVNIAAECCYAWGTLLPEDILITNNLFAGTGRGIHFWLDRSNEELTNSYRNVDVLHNVFFSQVEAAFSFDAVPTRHHSPRGSEIRNNIIYASANGVSLDIPQRKAWSFSNNDWPDGMPPSADGPGSLVSDPLFVRPPSIESAPEDFKLLPGSPLERAAVYDERVPADMWGRSRPRRPAIGLFEP